jgi:hypothetical protein
MLGGLISRSRYGAPGGEVRNHVVNRRGESTEGIPQGLKPFDPVATERAKAEALAYLRAREVGAKAIETDAIETVREREVRSRRKCSEFDGQERSRFLPQPASWPGTFARCPHLKIEIWGTRIPAKVILNGLVERFG